MRIYRNKAFFAIRFVFSTVFVKPVVKFKIPAYLLSGLFAPDHFVDDACVGLDEFDDFVGNVFVNVVGDGEAAVAVAVHFNGYVDRLQQGGFVDAGQDEVAFVEGFGAFGGGADAHGGDGFAYGEEE